jgi:carbonic anhydrase/acetyltransferase-like protein (isoleucine patch superfamily)
VVRLEALMRVLELDTRIAPFGDRVGDLPLLDRDVGGFRAREAEASGGAERLVFADYALATAPVLRAFLRAARGPSRLALPRTSASALLAPVSSIEKRDELLLFDVFADAEGDLETLRRAKPVVAEVEERTVRRELHRAGPPPHHLDLPADGALAAHLEHWVHLLWVAPLLVPALLSHARKRNLIAKTASVHHTAHVEGSVIGEGTSIGADCAIQGSYVGPRSVLSDFTKATCSVLGEATHTLADACFHHAVSLGDGTLANLLLRDTILGKKVFLTSGVIFWNEGITKTIRVLHRGELADTERKNLGGCAGHGCILGARTIVAPGRALPNRTTVVMRREEGVMRFEVENGAPACWYDGALVPVSRVMPGYVAEEIE